MIKIYNIIVTTFMIALLAACSSETIDFALSPSLGERVDVVLPVSGSKEVSTTRTALDPNDPYEEDVIWCVGDQVALWADGLNDSNSDLVGEMFQLKYFNTTFDSADFSGSINEMSSNQKYDYTAFYPYTSTINGKVVSFNLPEKQTGYYEGSYDFRAAQSVRGAALSDIANDDFSLQFSSIMHALRITIPEGYNVLGDVVNKLTITMPEEVVGDMTFDMDDSSAAPQIVSNGSKSVVVELTDRTITDGDGEYVWVFIKPLSGVTGDIIITGTTPDGVISCDYAISLENHTFAAGRITPINASILEERSITTLQIKVGENNIGEELRTVKIIAPTGGIFIESGTNTVTLDKNKDDIYEANYRTYTYGDKFKAGSLSVELESDQTLVPATYSLASIEDNKINTFEKDIPYVLYEDFSDVNSYNKNGFPTVGDTTTSSGDKDYVDLSDKGLSYTGWTATRSSCNGSGVMSICCRSEMDTSSTLYEGRLNSPALGYLKSGAKIKVTYDYDGSYYARECKVIWWSDYTSGEVWYQRGYFTGDDPSAENDIANIVCSDGSTVFSSSESGKDTLVSTYWKATQTYATSQDGSFYVSNASSSTRLAWRVWGSGRPTLGNANYCLYVTNVVVQVVPN